jgi:hypothetical protein
MSVSVLGVALFLACSSPSAGATGESSVVEEIRKLYALVNTAVRERRTVDVVLTSDASGFSGGVWRRESRGGSGATASQGGIVATVSYMAGVPVKVVFAVSSPSGDWRNSTEYIFYSNGKTAFRFERHVTLLGPESSPGVSPPFVVEDRRYFDPRGRQARALVDAFAEKSKTKVPPDEVRVEMPRFDGTASLRFPFLSSRPRVNPGEDEPENGECVFLLPLRQRREIDARCAACALPEGSRPESPDGDGRLHFPHPRRHGLDVVVGRERHAPGGPVEPVVHPPRPSEAAVRTVDSHVGPGESLEPLLRGRIRDWNEGAEPGRRAGRAQGVGPERRLVVPSDPLVRAAPPERDRVGGHRASGLAEPELVGVRRNHDLRARGRARSRVDAESGTWEEPEDEPEQRASHSPVAAEMGAGSKLHRGDSARITIPVHLRPGVARRSQRRRDRDRPVIA